MAEKKKDINVKEEASDSEEGSIIIDGKKFREI
jgi:hypothetical protein